jgi:hypothetical protein
MDECARCKSKNIQYRIEPSVKCNQTKIVCMDCGFEF